MKKAALIVSLAASLFAGTAAAATPHPDGHDRALVARLGAKATAFQALAAKSDDTTLQTSLDKCPAIKNDPSQAFAAVFALLPALLIDVVNQFKPQLTDLRTTLGAMHPHEPLFRKWLAAEGESLRLILQFDNHGKKIDYCKAATVMLDKHSTPADVRRVLGVDPALLATLFAPSASSASANLKQLNTRIRPFLVSGGLTLKLATKLTS